MKYNLEFKRIIIKAYLNNEGCLTNINKKFEMSDTMSIRTWINAYEVMGITGLEPSQQQRLFSVNFKLIVLQYIQDTGESIQKTANHFKLNNPSLIASWKIQFEKHGLKGRPNMLNKKR